MKDLKHLLYFENLLQNANNELIEQARKDGKICAAFTCENIPDPDEPWQRVLGSSFCA